jgi:hypothetical protein
MWTCPVCVRSFRRTGQTHSCRVVPVADHFRGKPTAQELFDGLKGAITDAIGPCTVVSLPCCIHLADEVDYLAVLPKQDRLEVRFTLHDEINRPRIVRSVRTGPTAVKHCVDVATPSDIDEELLTWIRRAHEAVER